MKYHAVAVVLLDPQAAEKGAAIEAWPTPESVRQERYW
jgi:hypothetical protein